LRKGVGWAAENGKGAAEIISQPVLLRLQLCLCLRLRLFAAVAVARLWTLIAILPRRIGPGIPNRLPTS
jgi:hypothetical protein